MLLLSCPLSPYFLSRQFYMFTYWKKVFWLERSSAGLTKLISEFLSIIQKTKIKTALWVIKHCLLSYFSWNNNVKTQTDICNYSLSIYFQNLQSSVINDSVFSKYSVNGSVEIRIRVSKNRWNIMGSKSALHCSNFV